MASDVVIGDPEIAAAWAAATPEHRGGLFVLGHRLWQHRGEVLLDDVRHSLERVRQNAEAERGHADEERARLRLDMVADAEAWSKRLMAAQREAGASAALVTSVERERGLERERASRELLDARASSDAQVREAVGRALAQAERAADERVAEFRAHDAELQFAQTAAVRAAKADADAQLDAIGAELRAAKTAAADIEARVRAEKDAMRASMATELEAARARVAADAEARVAELASAKAFAEAERDRLARENERNAAAWAGLRGGATAADKGRAGEAAARDAIAHLYPGSIIVDKSATGASGDLWWTMPLRARPVLVEVKNYTGDLPMKEVDKFLRDVSLNRETICGAVLACYRCPSVPTMPGKICFSFTTEGVPIVSVCEAEDNLVASLSAFVMFLGAREELMAANVEEGDFQQRLHDHLTAASAAAEAALKAHEASEKCARLCSENASKAFSASQRVSVTLRANLDALRATMVFVGLHGSSTEASIESSAEAPVGAPAASSVQAPVRRGRPRSK